MTILPRQEDLITNSANTEGKYTTHEIEKSLCGSFHPLDPVGSKCFRVFQLYESILLA